MRHDVVLSGTVGAFNRAFRIHLHHYAHDGGRYRAHDEPVHLPQELASAVIAVHGLEDVPLHRFHAASGSPSISPPVTVAELAAYYGFPDAKTVGHRIALIEFGGGYHKADLEQFARGAGISLPTISAVSVKGSDGKRGKNSPLSAKKTAAIATAWKTAPSFAGLFKEFGADLTQFMATFEVTMDVELSAAFGAGAAVDVIFAPIGADGWRRAIYAALGAPVGGGTSHRKRPTVLAISWGDSEANFGTASLKTINDALFAAQRMGVVVCCSSGDRGTSNTYATQNTTGCESINTCFPASSPAVVACGGTTLNRQPAAPGFAETAWKEAFFQSMLASGGGMSGYFERPAFQSEISASAVHGTWLAPGNGSAFKGRWLPDLAANAAFSSGVAIRIGGVELPGGGTSASAPLVAALLLRVSAAVGHPLAGLTSWLYSHAHRLPCTDVSVGDNDVCRGSAPFYHAGPGWDACTGWGSPNGAKLIAALTASLPTASASAA